MIALIIIIGLLLLISHGIFFWKIRYFWKPLEKVEVGEIGSFEWPPKEFVETIEGIKSGLNDVKAEQEKLKHEEAKVFMALAKAIDQIPTKTLNTIQGSANTTTGKLGELIQFIELQRAYDRIFPVGDIVDFIAIRFPNGTDKGIIDFIDVKTGDKAVLNSDQKKLRTMITETKDVINFKLVKVDIT